MARQAYEAGSFNLGLRLIGVSQLIERCEGKRQPQYLRLRLCNCRFSYLIEFSAYYLITKFTFGIFLQFLLTVLAAVIKHIKDRFFKLFSIDSLDENAAIYDNVTCTRRNSRIVSADVNLPKSYKLILGENTFISMQLIDGR